VYLAPRSRFWEHDGYAASLFTDTQAGMVAAARNRDNPSEVTTLAAWITGEHAAALDRMPSGADAGRAVIAAIEALRPAAKGQLELIGLQSWGADPHARGAWTYFRPGQVTRFAAVLGRAHGRLHFCGEHLSASSRGMEGAMESAEEAAAEILASG
jgi:monoamine oxidase